MVVLRRTEEIFKIDLIPTEFEKFKSFITDDYAHSVNAHSIRRCELWGLVEKHLEAQDDIHNVDILTFVYIGFQSFELKVVVYREIPEIKPFNPNT